jgi:hypothetical protein
MVLMPRGFTVNAAKFTGVPDGGHTSIDDNDFFLDPDTWWIAWSTWFEDSQETMKVICHELVEMFTDPELHSWYSGNLSGEIGDISQRGIDRRAWINGVHARAYWSNRHNASVMPIDQDYTARITGIVHVDKRDSSTSSFRPDASDNAMCGQLQACCIADREYSYSTEFRDETVTLEVSLSPRFRSPRIEWRVDGAIVGSAPVTIEGVICETYNGRVSNHSQQTITLAHTVAGNRLTLSAIDTRVNFDMQVSCTVTETAIDGDVQQPLQVSPQVTVGFAGVTVNLDDDYMAQRLACAGAVAKHYAAIAKTMPPLDGPTPPGPGELEGVLARVPVYLRRAGWLAVRQAVKAISLTSAIDRKQGRVIEEMLMRDIPGLTMALLKQRQMRLAATIPPEASWPSRLTVGSVSAYPATTET